MKCGACNGTGYHSVNSAGATHPDIVCSQCEGTGVVSPTEEPTP